MRKIFIVLTILAASAISVFAEKLWDNGPLKVSANQRFLQFENGKPFFWLGETAWLMPERLNRDEVGLYLKTCNTAGYNMVQIQVLNGVPSFNVYGIPSHDKQGRLLTDVPYSYRDHLDYIIDETPEADANVSILRACSRPKHRIRQWNAVQSIGSHPWQRLSVGI